MHSQYRFKIDGGFKPETLPLERLAEYLGALAELLGEEAYIHFRGVETGSAVLVADVDDPARPKVLARVRAVGDGSGAKDAARAFRRLDDLLREDNAVGELRNDADVVIPFPGRSRAEPLAFGPMKQSGTLDGQVLRVGGKDRTVPVHLRDGEVVYVGLWAAPPLARRIAAHLLGPTIRVQGTGSWIRTSAGLWELKSFRIRDFDVLDDSSLEQVVAEVRVLGREAWADVDDAGVLLRELRGGGAVA